MRRLRRDAPQLANPSLWLAAVEQIFLSLFTGFGLIITRASYRSEKDGAVFSGLTAGRVSEFCEVALCGMTIVITILFFIIIAAAAGRRWDEAAGNSTGSEQPS